MNVHAQCYESKVKTCKSPNKLHRPIADRYTYFVYTFSVFEIFELKRCWPRFRTVQGQQRSKDMMPIDSARMVAYSTSIDHIIVSVTVFEMFDIKF